MQRLFLISIFSVVGAVSFAQDSAQSVLKKITVKPYGYFNVSTIYETTKSNGGDVAAWAVSPDLTDEHHVCFIDPRSSRFGVVLNAPGIPAWKGSYVKGVVEVDFQGAYSLRSKSALLFRKGFIEIGDAKTQILIGQDWEALSPLAPTMLDYPAGDGGGNAGYRRAQIRLTHKLSMTEKTALTFQAAVADNTMRDGIGLTGITTEVASFPTVEGRLALSLGNPPKPFVLGVSGHYGQQQMDYAVSSGLIAGGTAPLHKDYESYSLNVDLCWPINKWLTLKGEWFTGNNLASIEAGILQGIDLGTKETVRSTGGWAAMTVQCTKNIQCNFGYLEDNPKNEDLLGGTTLAGTSRTYTQSMFGNFLYNWDSHLMTGLEISHWHTDWQKYTFPNLNTGTPGELVTLRPGDLWRFEFTVRYSF